MLLDHLCRQPWHDDSVYNVILWGNCKSQWNFHLTCTFFTNKTHKLLFWVFAKSLATLHFLLNEVSLCGLLQGDRWTPLCCSCWRRRSTGLTQKVIFFVKQKFCTINFHTRVSESPTNGLLLNSKRLLKELVTLVKQHHQFLLTANIVTVYFLYDVTILYWFVGSGICRTLWVCMFMLMPYGVDSPAQDEPACCLYYYSSISHHWFVLVKSKIASELNWAGDVSGFLSISILSLFVWLF